ncbi:hypothetical protein DFJ74DRAFT_606093, partial [Hyaloraphidium curvatum]
IRGARKRVVLSSLYIGSEQHELIQTLRDSLAENPSLEVQILIDALRGTRAKGGESSVSLLRPLAKEFPRRASVALYHTPALGPALKAALPDRFREAFGLQHMKIYLFDDDLILSGANLNTDYFENRQDRYMRFEGCAGLADFYSDLVHTVASFSYGLGVAELEPKGPDPSRSPAEFKSHAARQLDALKRKWMDSSAALRENLKEGGQHTPPGDTLVVPYVQQGQLGIRDDEAMIEALLAAFAQGMGRGWMVHFTSGYLNFPRRFVDLIMSSESARYAVLTASPMANGWFASKGVSRFIPDAYRLLERNFLQEVEGRGIQGRIEVSEWIKQGWTFHCKGLWAQRADEADPCITLIGSTNYGERSMTRDLESEVLIATMNPALRSKVGEVGKRLGFRWSILTKPAGAGRDLPRRRASRVRLHPAAGHVRAGGNAGPQEVLLGF